jgi:ligand-binding sensor domain-containing protein
VYFINLSRKTEWKSLLVMCWRQQNRWEDIYILWDEEGFETDEVLSSWKKYGNLWFGTGGSGVNLYNPGALVQYTRYEEYNKGISCILEDSQANLWFGSRGGGLFRYDGEVFNRFTVDEVIGNNFIEYLLQDRNDNPG